MEKHFSLKDLVDIVQGFNSESKNILEDVVIAEWTVHPTLGTLEIITVCFKSIANFNSEYVIDACQLYNLQDRYVDAICSEVPSLVKIFSKYPQWSDFFMRKAVV